MMRMSAPLQAAIRADVDDVSLRAAALADGMTSLRSAAATRVLRGDTSVEEALSVVPPQP